MGQVSTRSLLLRIVAWIVLTAGVGCGGSDGSNAGGTAQCQAACARCGSDPCADCASYSARFRDEFETALYSCVQNAATCLSMQWEICAVQASVQASDRPIDDQYRSACLTKKRVWMCDAAGSGFADDYCLSSQVFEEASVTQANGCLTLSCTDAKTC